MSLFDRTDEEMKARFARFKNKGACSIHCGDCASSEPCRREVLESTIATLRGELEEARQLLLDTKQAGWPLHLSRRWHELRDTWLAKREGSGEK
jgi:hypothetical protein